jgi:predicted dehydrogenase
MIGVGVVGYGYWGPNLARAVSEADATRLEMIADASPSARDRASRRYPSCRTVPDCFELVTDPAVDAVLIATPVHTHYEIAMAALRAGKHVLVEKPITDSPLTAKRLVDEAERRGLVLMVDHTFVYTGAVQAIANLIGSGRVGDVYYYDSTRVNLGLFQRDVNVIWDLAVHDFAIMDHLLRAEPVAISASGAGFVANRPENMAHLSIFYNDGALAHLNVNWLAPVKVRRTMIGGSRQMVVYDDMENSEKVKVYDRGVSLSEVQEESYEHLVSYRIGDMFAPALSTKEALLTEIEEFTGAIFESRAPLTDGRSGLRVVEMLAAASRSMTLRGQPVELGLMPERIAS